MEVKCAVIFLFVAAVAVVNCAPANEKDLDSDSEVVVVPLEHQFPGYLGPGPYGQQPVVDTGFFNGPFFNPFGSFIQNFESMLTRLRQQLSSTFGRRPNSNDTDADVSFPVPELPAFPNIDLGKGNTTSVVKVINGHKVVINETEYKQEGELGGAFFKVRVIDVRPESGESTEKTEGADESASTEVQEPQQNPQTGNRDVESVENSSENEIPKSKDNEGGRYDNLETFDEVDALPSEKLVVNAPESQSPASFENNDIETLSNERPIDISRDIYVNQLMADAGAPVNPDAEIFDPIDSQISRKYRPNSKFERMVARHS